MVPLVIAGDDLVNDLLGNVPAVFFKLYGFQYGFNVLYLEELQTAEKLEQQFDIAHAQFNVLFLKMAARVGSVNGSTGTSFEMDAIGSCFIGGASAYGGSGTVGGVVIGALLLGVINMGMSIMGIGDSWQYVVKGAVLLIAVVFDVLSNRKNG